MQVMHSKTKQNTRYKQRGRKSFNEKVPKEGPDVRLLWEGMRREGREGSALVLPILELGSKQSLVLVPEALTA